MHTPHHKYLHAAPPSPRCSIIINYLFSLFLIIITRCMQKESKQQFGACSSQLSACTPDGSALHADSFCLFLFYFFLLTDMQWILRFYSRETKSSCTYTAARCMQILKFVFTQTKTNCYQRRKPAHHAWLAT